MFTQNHIAFMKGFEVKVTSAQLAAFAAMYRLPDDIQNRISELL
jgi:hypothetical protein